MTRQLSRIRTAVLPATANRQSLVARQTPLPCSHHRTRTHSRSHPTRHTRYIAQPPRISQPPPLLCLDVSLPARCSVRRCCDECGAEHSGGVQRDLRRAEQVQPVRVQAPGEARERSDSQQRRQHARRPYCTPFTRCAVCLLPHSSRADSDMPNGVSTARCTAAH